MKNLFIMHTQYNLILASAVISRKPDSENTLILFSEFSLTDKILDSLKKIFDKVIIAREKFHAPISELDGVKEIRRCLRKVRTIKNEYYDNIYMSQERIFDLIVCNWVKKTNPKVWCSNIEEDAYYSIDEKFNDDDYRKVPNRRAKRNNFLRALLLFGYRYNYREVGYCYGMNSEYQGVNLLFPQLARRELRGKELVEITQEELINGIKTIYSGYKIKYPSADKYVVFFFDLMTRYKNPQVVKDVVKEILVHANKENRMVLVKYHPRETDKFTDIGSLVEISHLIPAEKVLYDLRHTDTIVIGNATTSCVVAAKLGFKVVSICKLETPSNIKMHDTMEKMNIFCVDDIANIKNYFNGGI